MKNSKNAGANLAPSLTSFVLQTMRQVQQFVGNEVVKTFSPPTNDPKQTFAFGEAFWDGDEPFAVDGQ